MTNAEAIADIIENLSIATTIVACVWLWLRFLKDDQ